VCEWLRRFGEPRFFKPERLSALLADTLASRHSLRRWVSHPVYATPTETAPAGREELIGYDILKWGGTGTSAGIVLEVRGLNERLRLDIIVDVGGRRVLEMDNFPELQVEIRSMESLATLLERIDTMNICGGAPGRVGFKTLPFY